MKKVGQMFAAAVMIIALLCAGAAAETADLPLTAAGAEEAAVLLREQLVARNTDFTLQFPGAQFSQEDAESLYKQAVQHTGTPWEGDYLRLQIVDCIPQISSVTADGTECVSIRYQPVYRTTAAMEKMVDEAVARFFDAYPVREKATDYEKVLAIYAFLCDTVAYDTDRKLEGPLYYDMREDKDVLIAHTGYAAIVEGKAVCEGYAAMFYRLSLEMGIDARVVSGEAGEPHSWNIVCLDGKYYQLDATWDSSNIGWYEYFLLPELWLHTPNEGELDGYTMADAAYEQPEQPVYTEGMYSYTLPYGANITGYSGSEPEVTVPAVLGGVPVVSASSGAFYSEDTASITFPEGFCRFRNVAINCANLAQVHLPSTLVWSEDDTEWMVGSQVAAITVDENNPYICVQDGVVYTRDMKTLMMCPAKLQADTLTVPDGVEKIQRCAFRYADGIRKVALPDGLKEIGLFAFDYASALEEINIPEGCEQIGQWAFGHTALKQIHLPASLTSLGGAVFAHCKNLESITIAPESENYFMIGSAIFNHPYDSWLQLLAYPAACEGTEYTVPDKTIYISSLAFSESALESITLSDELVFVDACTFSNCRNLKSITIPEGVHEIYERAFEGCMSLEKVTVLARDAEIYDDMFDFRMETEKITIAGYPDSTAEEYAAAHNHPFEALP